MSVEDILSVHESRNEQMNLYRKAIHRAALLYLEDVRNIKPFGTRMKAPGEDLYNTFYWQAMREYVMERDGGKCSVCGGTDRLEVHHIIRRMDGGSNNPVNLTLMCQGCHDDIHSNDLAERRYAFYENEMLMIEKEIVKCMGTYFCDTAVPENERKLLEKAYATIHELAESIRSRDNSVKGGSSFVKPSTRQARLGDGE